MYIVIHSTDPYLLARLATDLQMEGLEYFPTDWNSDPFGDFKRHSNPIDENRRQGSDYWQDWMLINGEDRPDTTFCFFNVVPGDDPKKRFELLGHNYAEVLGFIIRNHAK